MKQQLSIQQRLRVRFPELVSERLLLRKIESKDCDTLFQFVTDPLVGQHMSFQSDTLLFPERLYRYFEESYRSLRDLHFAMIWRDTGEVVGICSMQQWSTQAGKARLGYLVSPSFWNLGIATEAAGMVLDFGVNTLGIHEVEARCAVDNPASERVLQKLGLSFRAYVGNTVGYRGESEDHNRLKVYSLIKTSDLLHK